MPLILKPLRLALSPLHRAYQESCTHENASPTLKETLHVGVIQNFEVAYELSWKFMKCWLEHNDSTSAEIAESKRIYKAIYWFRTPALGYGTIKQHPCGFYYSLSY